MCGCYHQRQPTQHAKFCKNPAVGLWRQVPASKWPAATKTKAHRIARQAELEDDLANWKGNEQADLAAKAAALADDPPDIVEQVTAFREKAKTLLKGAVAFLRDLTERVVHSGCRTKSSPQRAVVAADLGDTRASNQMHDFRYLPGTGQRICRLCCLILQDEGDLTGQCTPHPHRSALAASARSSTSAGHTLRVAITVPEHKSFLYCVACGYHATARQRKLGRPCPISPRPATEGLQQP